jgi:type II secretory pathway pseudopilin PulG
MTIGYGMKSNKSIGNISIGNISIGNISVGNISIGNISIGNIGISNISISNISMSNISIGNISESNISMNNKSKGNISISNISMSNKRMSNKRSSNKRTSRMKNEKQHRNNEGITLVEIIVVVIIIALLSTGGLVVISRMRYTDTLKVAKEIDLTMSKVRLETMSKDGKPSIYLYNIDDTIYMKLSSEIDGDLADLDETSGKKLSIKTALYYKSISGDEMKLEHDQYIAISFTRSSGAFDTDFEYIKLQNTGSTHTIYCVKETGKHWVE